MVFDLEMIAQFYKGYEAKLQAVSKIVNRPLTLTEKILFAHLFDSAECADFNRNKDYVNFLPDRVAMQDATAQMALLQFMNSGRPTTAVPSSVHCDHLIEAESGVKSDIVTANNKNKEVYEFLRSVSTKYGIGFWKPGAGIIHQIVLENYAFPGGMIIGTDSHTVNAGGLGMVSIGVGGADAVDVMAGMSWELKMPRLIGVKLTGTLNGWTSPKDVILKIAGILTVKGGTNSIIEYFGEGADSLSCTGKATICNMGAEVGATTSIFAYDDSMRRYLSLTGRQEVVDLADTVKKHLRADDAVYQNPEKYYDQIIEINLSELEPHINGPLTPDAATPLSQFAAKVKSEGFPQKLSVGLIGSCTNSSYQDMSRAASLAKQAKSKNLKAKAEFIITPGSEMVKSTALRDGLIADFESIGGILMANACGPCIGQWNRKNDKPEEKNAIINSFNRNFSKRADGNPNTLSFVASPEIVTAFSIAGSMTFNPITDTLINEDGQAVKLDPPSGDELPVKGYVKGEDGFIAPAANGKEVEVVIAKASDRLQALAPFTAWDGKELTNMPLLIKAKGKCTTDHISMAGQWLKYRGHLENISDNLLMGAENSFNGLTNSVKNQDNGSYDKVSSVAKYYKSQGKKTIIVAEENYGEGSSREHAAMEPRFLNAAVVLTKSFARIHETNLKKQGMLAVTFVNKVDYDKIQEDDTISISGLSSFAPSTNLKLELKHKNGSTETFEVQHTYNEAQIAWFKAGSALNLISKTV
jgi:aconitate hydratase